MALTNVGRPPGAALLRCCEPRHADQAEGSHGNQRRARINRGSDRCREQWTHNPDYLLSRRIKRKGLRQLAPVGEQRGPPRSHRGSEWRIREAIDHAETEQEKAAGWCKHCECQQRRHLDQHAENQHQGLSLAVDQTTEDGRSETRAERRGTHSEARNRVRTARTANEQEQRECTHAHRHPTNDRGDEQAWNRRNAKNVSVGVSHVISVRGIAI